MTHTRACRMWVRFAAGHIKMVESPSRNGCHVKPGRDSIGQLEIPTFTLLHAVIRRFDITANGIGKKECLAEPGLLLHRDSEIRERGQRNPSIPSGNRRLRKARISDMDIPHVSAPDHTRFSPPVSTFAGDGGAWGAQQFCIGPAIGVASVSL